MSRCFNITGACNPKYHYMVNLESRLAAIKVMVDRGDYFVINRARQYGKTTLLNALKPYLQNRYTVISLDFQMISHANFDSEEAFVKAFSREVLMAVRQVKGISEEFINILKEFAAGKDGMTDLGILFFCLSDWCAESKKPVVLMIDEVDSASNNQVFLDFLSMLRGYYIHREERPTFQSVILAGVHDIKNIRRKIRPEDQHRINSPWNIAARFDLDMSFSAEDIRGMLKEYCMERNVEMNVDAISGMIYDYTSGYPLLVSQICKIADEQLVGSADFPDYASAWTDAGILEAVKIILNEKSTLFESLVHKLTDYPELRTLIYDLLFSGKRIPYDPMNQLIEIAEMFGFLKKSGNDAVISNRIFETALYNLFCSEESVESEIYKAALQDKNQFIQNGHLNMDLVLEKFVTHFNDTYGDQKEEFVEADGRRYFLLFLRPIINGTGNYYIEAETRNMERTDVIVDYRGEQFIIEMKIWRGAAYHERGEQQLRDYLDYYHLRKGYMLSFNFNKKKTVGVQRINLGDKVLIEAVV